MFLIFASSGLRLSEVLRLKVSDVKLNEMMIIVNHSSRTKKGWVSFFNEEAEAVLRQYLEAH